MKCKWYAEFEGVCTNGECPYRIDTCPTSEHPEVCKYAEKKPEIPQLSAEELAETLRLCGSASCTGCALYGFYDCGSIINLQAADMLEKLAAEKDAKKAMSEAKNQRLIDVDALLEAMPKDDVLLSCDVRKVILDAPIVDAVPLDFHNLCLEIGRAEIEKLIALVKKNEWISVKDRLPDSNNVVFACIDDGQCKIVRSAYVLSYGEWKWIERHQTVTHWMTLPVPPKEEKHVVGQFSMA